MKNLGTICPLCEQGLLRNIEYSDRLEIRGEEMLVNGLVASVCSSCGEESMSSAQLSANAHLITKAKEAAVDGRRAVMGLLQSSEVRAVRESLGLTQKQASLLFGGGKNGFSKYERGQTIQSEIMDSLLRIVSEVPEAAHWLMNRKNIVPSSSLRREDEIITSWFNVEDTGDASTPLGTLDVSLRIESDMPDSRQWKSVPLALCAGAR